MPMQAYISPVSLQLEISTSSVVLAARKASIPRPDLMAMQSSPDSMSQFSMRTCLQESTSMPSPLVSVVRMVRFLATRFSQ